MGVDGRSLDFDFEDALEGKAEDDGQGEIDDKPVEMPSEKAHIFGRIKNFYGF